MRGVTDIAAALGFPSPAVNRAIKTPAGARAASEHEDYGTIRPDRRGRTPGRDVIRPAPPARALWMDILGVEGGRGRGGRPAKLEHALSYDNTGRSSSDYLRTVLADFEH